MPGRNGRHMRGVSPTGVVLVAFLVLGTADAAQIGSATVDKPELPRFQTVELDLDVAGQWDNPFDPDQADVMAHFIAPSGKALDVPAFLFQPYEMLTVAPADRRKTVQFLKLYVTEQEWEPGAQIELFVDDVELIDATTGDRVPLDDLEAADAAPWGPEQWASRSAELAHAGSHSLRLLATADREESWPGVVKSLGAADWSAYSGVSLWVYPRVSRIAGALSLYFRDEQSGNSPIMAWRAEGGEVQPNQWNHLVWDWGDFRPARSFHATGEPRWKVRFTPAEVGEYRYRVTARDRDSGAESPEGRLTVAPSDRPGFVRVSPHDPHYFAHDDGRLFFPIGHDVAWRLDAALEYFPKMAAHGENCTYLILCPWDMSIEWEKLAVYDLMRAAMLDQYVRCAEENGIYLKLSFDIHDAMRANARWGENPYNAERGGPCAGPNDFYTDPRALELYKKRLRYIVARWGHSTHILGWETFAEVDGSTELDGGGGWRYPEREGGDRVSAMLVNWHRAVYGYLRELDPYDHLLTLSFGGNVSDPNIWAMPEIEYTQIHQYNDPDAAAVISAWCRKLTAEYAKPMMVTEFGWYSDWKKTAKVDPGGICVHNGIWASVMSGAAGGAQTWWCDRVDELNLYPHFQALRNFARDVAWDREGFRPAEASVSIADPDHFVPVILPGRGPFSGGTASEFTVARDGSVEDPAQVPATLLAAGRPEPHVVPVFHVDYPVAGRFVVHVDAVSPDARLDVYLDDELALSWELPASGVEGKECVFDDRWQVWRCVYNEDFAIDVPAGKHRIRLENGKPGISWIRIARYVLTDYSLPAVRAMGLTGRETTVLWLQNPENTWGNDELGVKPQPITGASVAVTSLRDGAYEVEWWDTYEGKPTGRQAVACRDGRLTLAVPPLTTDVAYKIRRAR